MMSELAKCPFCGKETVEIKQTGKFELTLRCKEGCIHYKQKVLRKTLAWLEDHMINMWNTRPIEDALRAENEKMRKMISSVYVIAPTPQDYRQITVERALQPDGSSLWAIRQPGGFCMDKDGDFEFEPLPSNRTDDFFKRCRFATMDEAIQFAISATKQEGEK